MVSGGRCQFCLFRVYGYGRQTVFRFLLKGTKIRFSSAAIIKHGARHTAQNDRSAQGALRLRSVSLEAKGFCLSQGTKSRSSSVALLKAHRAAHFDFTLCAMRLKPCALIRAPCALRQCVNTTAAVKTTSIQHNARGMD